MQERIFQINGTAACPAPAGSVELQQAVTIDRTQDGGARFCDAAGRLLGTVTARHELARILADGATVALHASVNSVRGPCEPVPKWPRRRATAEKQAGAAPTEHRRGWWARLFGAQS